jgi:hypothetical protein
LLKLVDNPVVMETHGGYGAIWNQCYMDIAQGVVFEKDADKTKVLAVQRPAWAVYECDCEMALAAGVGSHLPVNFLDCDPYGAPWPVLDAFFLSDRPFPPTLAIVVNDGLRQGLEMNGGWKVESLRDVVSVYGNNTLYANYLEICKELLQEKASQRGYTLTRWAGYYCGHAQQMTHYAGLFNRDAG